MKNTWLDRTLIRGPRVILCLTEKDFNVALKDIEYVGNHVDMFGDGDAAAHHFRDAENGVRTCIVVLRKWEGADPVEIAGTLVHEACHVWQEYVDWVGEQNPSREFEACSIENISVRLMRSFMEQTSAKPPRSGRASKRTRRTA